jgi:hypothetical protein
VRCVGVVQRVKFGRDVYLAGAGRTGLEVLEGRSIDALWTEEGRVEVADAALVARTEGLK